MAASKVMISLPQEFLQEIDRVAKEEQRSRSELIREALRLYLQVRQTRQVPGQDPLVREVIALQDAIAAQDSVAWDGTTEIRRWRDRQ